jgi:hypothetical protein
MDPPGIERLRSRLRQHNRLVLCLTILTSAATAALWALLYLGVWWASLFAGVFRNPADLDYQPPTRMLIRGFVATGLLLCLVAWIARKARPDDGPVDHKSIAGHGVDLLLAVPRLTLAIFGTGAAAARLSEGELTMAWGLLRRMSEEEKPLSVQSLPVQIANPDERKRILLALQLSGIVELRTTASGQVLAFQNEEARQLAQERVRLVTTAAEEGYDSGG